MSAIKKYLIKKLAAKAGYSPEELPMSVSEPRLMEDLRRGLAPMIPGGPYQRGEASRLDIKFPIQTKTKTQKELSAEENRILQEKRLDKILENPLATIKRQRVESSDDVIDIPTGMSIEEARKKLADVPAEATSGKNIISQIGKLSPTTLTRSKAVDLKGPKAKELVKTMNRLEKSEIEQNKLLSSISKTKQNADKESDFKQVEMLTKSLNKEINSKQNKLDRAALRKYFKEKKIAEGEPVKVRPVSKKKRDTDTGKVTVTKGTTSRDLAKGLDDESQLPNIVGQASDPKSPVTKLDIQADPGFARKTDQEFFDNKVQDYLDQGDDLKTSRARARNDLGERKLSEEYTGDQLRDLLGEGVLETDLGEIADSEATKMLERAFEEGLTKKKAGGQVGKPKRKIKKSVRGNDLVAMMYD